MKLNLAVRIRRCFRDGIHLHLVLFRLLDIKRIITSCNLICFFLKHHQ